MLEKFEVKEKALIENGKLYAYCFRGATKRELDPCEYRKELQETQKALEEKKASLEAELEETIKEMAEAKKIDNQLASLGYCLEDTPVYKKIDGIVQRDSDGNPVVSSYTHSMTCPNYKEG